MKLEIVLAAGPDKHEPTKFDVQKNIDALQRAVKKANAADGQLIIDTISILRGIQDKLPT